MIPVVITSTQCYFFKYAGKKNDRYDYVYFMVLYYTVTFWIFFI